MNAKTLPIKQNKSNYISIKQLFIIFYLLGLIIAGFELLTSPHPHYAKQYGIFPSLPIGIYRFTLMELFSVLFISLFFVALIAKILKFNKLSVSLAPSRVMTILILLFICNLCAAIFLGLILRNTEVFVMLRTHFFLMSFLVIYYFREQVFNYKYIVFGLTNSLGILFASFAILNFTLNEGRVPLPWLLPDDLYVSGMWFGMYLTLFALSYHLSKLIFDRYSFWSLIVVVVALLAVVLRIANKPIVLSAAVVIFVLALVMLLVYKRGYGKVVMLMGIVFVVFSSILSSPEIKGEILSTFVERFYKTNIPPADLSSANFIDIIALSSEIQVGGVNDISGGRFELWLGYTAAGLGYPVVTPFFGNRPSIFLSTSGREEVIAPHNAIVHYIYYAGLPAAISLVLLMILFITNGWLYLKKTKSLIMLDLRPFQAISIYAFVLSIIAVELVGGPILSSVTFSWFFWSIITIFFVSLRNFLRISGLPRLS